MIAAHPYTWLPDDTLAWVLARLLRQSGWADVSSFREATINFLPNAAIYDWRAVAVGDRVQLPFKVS